MEMQTIKEENMVIDDDIPPPGGGGDGGAFLEEEEKALKIASSGGGSGGSLPASPTSVPNPKQGLFGGLPPFLRKTFEMVEDPETNEVISWSDSKKSFIVFDHNYFSANFLPKYFKHSNFSSFIKQLNIYGFKKIHSDTWEFENEGFQAGKKHLLKTIKRKKQNPQNLQQQETMRPLLHSPQSGVQAELQKLRNDWNEMKMEILKLKQQQESTESCLVAVKEKIENITKCRQQQIFVSMAKALANPAMPKLIKLLRQKRQLCNAQIAKKQRLAVPPSDKNSVEAMDDDSTTRQVADDRDTIESVLQTLLCNGQMAKKNRRFSGPQSDKNSVEAMEDDDDDSTTSQVGNGRDQNQAELATIESEVKTLFSASMGDEGSPSMDQKANVANPGSVSHDLSSENYILLEKLMNDEFDAQAEPELKQLHSKTVHEWESLIEATGGGNGSGFC